MENSNTEYKLATTADGIELYIHQGSGEVFASQRMLGRLVEKADTTIMRWMNGKQSAAQATPKMVEVPTPKGIRTAALYDEDTILEAFAKWKPDLLVQCSRAGVRLFLHGLAGYTYEVRQQPYPAEDPIISSLQQIMQVRQQQIDQERRIAALEQVRETALEELKALPAPSMEVPEETTDMKVRRIVNDHSAATGVAQGEVWRRLYQEHYYRCHSRVAAKGKESKLQAFVRLGKIDELYALATELFLSKAVG